MKINIVLVSVVLLIIIFGCSMIKTKAEGFGLLNPSTFPCSVDNPKLYGDYPVKKNPAVTDLQYSNIWQ